MIANMKSQAGWTLEQWLAIAKKTGAERLDLFAGR
jgi:hypothetical protein